VPACRSCFMPKLKVFRTTIGFHDAYVAAPSRAAALRAWGAATDLFAMGAAEEVTEPALMKKPLAAPGTVIKQARGTMSEHLAASSKPSKRNLSSGQSPKRSVPPPSRSKLDAADARLTEAEAEYERLKEEFEAEDAAITKRRQEQRRKHEYQLARLRETRDAADGEYRQATEEWRSE
jgi:hypothetical protein